jgi:hypothetical protein
MFSIVIDKDCDPLSKEELKEMQRGGLILLLRKKIRRIDYLHVDDRRMMLYLVISLQYSFQESKMIYGEKIDEKEK